MPKQSESFARFSLMCLLFTLMASVFAFGLHARIQLYRAGESTTPSKLSVQKRSSTEMVAETVKDDPPTPFGKLRALILVPEILVLGREILQQHQVESSLWNSRRFDSHNPSLMLRPPPVQI